MAEWYKTKSNVKLDGFQSHLEASYVSSHIQELRYNETLCLWMTMYIYIYIYMSLCVCTCAWGSLCVCVCVCDMCKKYVKCKFALRYYLREYSINVRAHMHTHKKYIPMHTHASIYNIYTPTHSQLYMYNYIYIYIYIYIERERERVHMCVCVFFFFHIIKQISYKDCFLTNRLYSICYLENWSIVFFRDHFIQNEDYIYIYI